MSKKDRILTYLFCVSVLLSIGVLVFSASDEELAEPMLVEAESKNLGTPNASALSTIGNREPAESATKKTQEKREASAAGNSLNMVMVPSPYGVPVLQEVFLEDEDANVTLKEPPLSASPFLRANLSEVQRRKNHVSYAPKKDLDAAAEAALEAVLEKYQISTVRTLESGVVLAVAKKLTVSEEVLAIELMNTRAVEFSEPDYAYSPGFSFSSFTNDPLSYHQDAYASINLPEAWDYQKNTPRVKVTVCDSGFDPNHEDLRYNYVSSLGRNVVSNNGDYRHFYGDGWGVHHGTAVAGVIAAQGNNGRGMVGVNWRASIIPVRITNASGHWAYLTDMADCIEWAILHDSKVVNLSYGGVGSSTVVHSARRLRDIRQGVLVWSAGNDARDLTNLIYDDPSYLVVGALDSKGASRVGFSALGKPVDLVAPGERVYLPIVGNRYDFADGTSFSAPMVSGVAAKLYAMLPGATNATIQGLLLAGATDIGSRGEDNTYGRGRLNAGESAKDASVSWVSQDLRAGNLWGTKLDSNILRKKFHKRTGPAVLTFDLYDADSRDEIRINVNGRELASGVYGAANDAWQRDRRIILPDSMISHTTQNNMTFYHKDRRRLQDKWGVAHIKLIRPVSLPHNTQYGRYSGSRQDAVIYEFKGRAGFMFLTLDLYDIDRSSELGFILNDKPITLPVVPTGDRRWRNRNLLILPESLVRDRGSNYLIIYNRHNPNRKDPWAIRNVSVF